MNTNILPAETDIVISGAGLTGLCLASLLARQQPSWNILLLQAAPPDDDSVTSRDAGFDHRQIVLAESSRRILSHMGLWSDIEQHTAAIAEIRVSDRGHIGRSQLVALEQNLDAYGYVIDAAQLASLLSAAVDKLPNVQRSKVTNHFVLKPIANGMVLQEGSNSVHARLTVLANGIAPLAAQKLGIAFQCKDYGQCALTAELTLTKAHRGIAYERFTSSGPIALLPLPDLNDSPRAALVWTLPLPEAEDLLNADEDTFIERLYVRFGQRIGPVAAVARRVVVPLARTVATEQVRNHLLLMGSSAHSLHPVAGQGFNLTLRDIATLGEVLSGIAADDGNLGNLASLQLYEERRRADQARVVAFSDVLPAVFANNNAPLSIARNLALLGLDLAPGLRNAFARFGAGLSTREARFND